MNFPHFSADQQSIIDLQFSLPTTIIKTSITINIKLLDYEPKAIEKALLNKKILCNFLNISILVKLQIERDNII